MTIATERFHLTGSQTEPRTATYSNLVSSIQQEASESVIVAFVIADKTSFGQADSHLVPSPQFHGHNNSGTVLKVLAILFEERVHHLAVDLQIGAGGQGGTRGTAITVDGEDETVDTRAGSGEDTGTHIVTVSQVEEDVFVDDDLVSTEGAIAAQHFVIV